MSAWSEADINLLREGAAAGLSTSVIAKQIGRGITRNAVIGKARRLRIALRAKSVRKVRVKPAPISGAIAVSDTDRRSMRKGKPAKIIRVSASDGGPEGGKRLQVLRGPNDAAEPDVGISTRRDAEAGAAISASAPIPRMVQLLDLKANECRWPVGDPKSGGFGFCGHPKASRAYCSHHAALSYVPLPLRRKAA